MRSFSKQTFFQILRFALVGGLNTLVDFLVFNAVAHVVGLQSAWWYFFCKSVAFIAAMVNSYLWNKRFTFREKERLPGTWWRFMAVTIGTFAIASALSTWAFHLLRVHTTLSAIIAGNASVVISIAIGMGTNFLGYKYVVFKR